jgi:uncharacterized membrane protein
MSESKETARMEAFSDGVFAVAITLLVLDIKVPTMPLTNPNVSLSHEMLAQWPTYVAFITSFLTILVMWINHHRIFGLINRSDDRFMLLNGVVLLSVTLFPFVTSLVAAYIGHPGQRLATLIYAGASVVLATCFQLLWRYASADGRLLAHNHDSKAALGITRSYRYGPHVYLAVFLVGFVNVPACLLLCMALAVFFTIPPIKHAECGR